MVREDIEITDVQLDSWLDLAMQTKTFKDSLKEQYREDVLDMIDVQKEITNGL